MIAKTGESHGLRTALCIYYLESQSTKWATSRQLVELKKKWLINHDKKSKEHLKEFPKKIYGSFCFWNF